MQYSYGRTGRIFTVKLDSGESLYESIEKLAEAEKLERAVLWIIGGVNNGTLKVGPVETSAMPPIPQLVNFHEAHEMIATGTIFPLTEEAKKECESD